MMHPDKINADVVQLLQFSGDVFLRIRRIIRTNEAAPDVGGIHVLADACENLQSLAANLAQGDLDGACFVAEMLVERFTDEAGPYHRPLSMIETLPGALDALRSISGLRAAAGSATTTT